MSKAGAPDIELKLGYNFVMSECCFMDAYIGVVFPSSNRPHGVYVFEPVTGNGKHWGLMWGGEVEFDIWNFDCGSVRLRMDLDARYLFRHCETRTFDLVGKPWSRYQAMFASVTEAVTMANAATATTQLFTGSLGAPIMTRDVDVTPRCQLTMNTGLEYLGECFLAEAGVTMYARQAEKICPNWYTGTAIPALQGYYYNPTAAVPTDSRVLTKSRTIRDRFQFDNLLLGANNANYSLVQINTCDVNWNSGAHPAVLHRSVYGTIGYQWGDICYPVMVSVGGAYDFSCSNAGMTRWTAFGKFGISF